MAEATVIADAFCHSMVRALMGALLKVATGPGHRRRPAQVLTARVRDPGVPVVPPHGLCLEEVRYPPPGQLAHRALATRRVRPALTEPGPAEPVCAEPVPVTGSPAYRTPSGWSG